MRSRLNSTGRKRIAKGDVQVSIRASERDEPPIFDLQPNLSDYGFPMDARVRVEAWRSNAVQRWDFGRVGDMDEPSENERRLTEVPTAAQFRVIVVAGDGSGLLLGQTGGIRPALPVRSLLPVRETDDLGQEVWRVDFGDGMDSPELLVNQNVEGISDIIRHEASFRSLVFPGVLRTILTHALLVMRQDPDDDEGPWEGWFRLARELVPDHEPPSMEHDASAGDHADGINKWIDCVCGAFADRSLSAADSFGSPAGGRT